MDCRGHCAYIIVWSTLRRCTLVRGVLSRFTLPMFPARTFSAVGLGCPLRSATSPTRSSCVGHSYWRHSCWHKRRPSCVWCRGRVTRSVFCGGKTVVFAWGCLSVPCRAGGQREASRIAVAFAHRGRGTHIVTRVKGYHSPTAAPVTMCKWGKHFNPARLQSSASQVHFAPWA
jgi:hypothetical protein